MNIHLIKFLVLTFLVSICSQTFAQDILYKKDNTKIEAKILEITPTTIKYNLFNYQEGPLITIDKKEVAMIIYQNGTREIIKSDEPINNGNVIIYREENKNNLKIKDSLRVAEWNEITQRNNIVSLNILSLFDSNFSVDYTREIKKANMQIYVPISVGFNKSPFTQPNAGLLVNYEKIKGIQFTRKVMESGIGIYINTSRKKLITHYIGTYIGMAQFNGTFEDIYKRSNGASDIVTHGFVMNRYYAMITNGVLFRISKYINIKLFASIGLRGDDFIINNPYYFAYYSKLPYHKNSIPVFNTIKCGFTIGYRF
jgi:hypothetical protein